MNRQEYSIKIYRFCGRISVLCFFFFALAVVLGVVGILMDNSILLPAISISISLFATGLVFAALQDIGQRQMRIEAAQRELMDRLM